MKKIRKNEQYFEIDFDANAQTYNERKTDSAPYAKNFVNQMRNFNPELNEFLDGFAVDIVKPDELKWSDVDNYVRYTSVYTAKGRIVDAGSFDFNVRKMTVNVIPNGDGELKITMDNIVLPWILLEDRDGKLPEVQPKGIAGKLKSIFKK